jgi:cell division septum initiation protein DivIVA
MASYYYAQMRGSDEMSRLTPEAIAQLSLRRSVGVGYSREETDRALADIAAGFEQVLQERAQLEEKLAELEARLPETRDLERRLRKALVTAERAGELARRAARYEAEATLKAARQRANKLVEDGERRKALLERKAERLEASARRRARTVLGDLEQERARLEDEVEGLRTARLKALRGYDQALGAAATWLRDELGRGAVAAASQHDGSTP